MLMVWLIAAFCMCASLLIFILYKDNCAWSLWRFVVISLLYSSASYQIKMTLFILFLSVGTKKKLIGFSCFLCFFFPFLYKHDCRVVCWIYKYIFFFQLEFRWIRFSNCSGLACMARRKRKIWLVMCDAWIYIILHRFK